MTDDEIIEVVRAHKEGKEIQCREIYPSVYYPTPFWIKACPLWNFERYEYRVAPEPRKPREWTVALHKDGTIWSPHSGTTGTDYTKIRVREVLE